MLLLKNKAYLLIITLSLLFISCSGDDNIVDDPDNDSPEACFEMTPTTAKVSDNITFTNCSQNANSFVWDFGDGFGTTQKDPSHSYSNEGEYNVKLTAGVDINNDGLLNNDDNPHSVTKNITVAAKPKLAEFTIYDATSWTQANPNYTAVEGAIVKLFSSEESLNSGEPDHTVESNENGIGTFYELEAGNYRLIVEKNVLSNISDGYIVGGVFESQGDIDNHAEQENATVGGIKYVDINADGLINTDDKHGADYITISAEETLIRDIYLADGN